MNHLKRRKKLSLVVIAFLVVALSGAAFAFGPGMLDIVGRVGIMEGDYVQWTLAAAQGDVPLTVSATITAGHANVVNTHPGLGTPARPNNLETISARSATVYESTVGGIEDARDRENQRITWQVVFAGPDDPAVLYVDATNFSTIFYAELLGARIVEATTGGPFAPFDQFGFFEDNPVPAGVRIAADELSNIFSLSGTFFDLSGDVLEPNDITGLNDDSTSDIATILLEWNGELPAGFFVGADTVPVQIWDDSTAEVVEYPVGSGTWITQGGAWIDCPDGQVRHVFADDYFWEDGDPWIATFVLELDYAIYTP